MTTANDSLVDKCNNKYTIRRPTFHKFTFNIAFRANAMLDVNPRVQCWMWLYKNKHSTLHTLPSNIARAEATW